MSRRKPSEEVKRRGWAAIERAAKEHHNHHGGRGLGLLIAEDAGVTPQSVSEWKHLRTAPDEKQLIRLASVYGVSIEELAGMAPAGGEGQYIKSDEFSRLSMELVSTVTSDLLPEGTYDQYVAVYQKAHDLLLEGKDRDAAFGILYRYVREMRASAANE